ncbi:hypothetical protein [Micromonospora deserti]|uniref:Uncharacterized protein n=1 Tax=Micromonospora deserti TaxID=2070366 RepID=A0A2W2D9D3_9ACTN|nr:hypothetical protein [Micromonospora deserti]PZG01975.1 hypothetical protein C1I99_04585 [Micromonospora deserti]
MVNVAYAFNDLLVEQADCSGDIAVGEGTASAPYDFGEVRAEGGEVTGGLDDVGVLRRPQCLLRVVRFNTRLDHQVEELPLTLFDGLSTGLSNQFAQPCRVANLFGLQG